MPVQSETFSCDKAFLGQYSLNISQIARLANSRDFRPNDEQKDEIVEQTSKWLSEMGFESLNYKT